MTDIMQEFKENKFTIASWAAPSGVKHLVVLGRPFDFWIEQYENLIEWAAANQCVVAGMTVEIPTDEALTLFCLKWN